jgi:hypothetical protein
MSSLKCFSLPFSFSLPSNSFFYRFSSPLVVLFAITLCRGYIKYLVNRGWGICGVLRLGALICCRAAVLIDGVELTGQVMEQQKDLEAFGALVYSSNFDYVAQSGDDGVAA